MHNAIVQHTAVPIGVLPRQATTDEHLVELWLHGRSEHTQRAYRADSVRFLAFVGQPRSTVTLGDVQAFADSLSGEPSSRARTLAAVKALLAFGQRTGYLPLNVGATVKLPSSTDTLAERILTEPDIVRMLALEPDRRNQVLLRLTYIAGLRVSEIAALTWRDLQPGTDGGQVSIFGKGGKTLVVLLPSAIWRELLRLRQGAGLDALVFASRRGAGHLHPTSIERMIARAAARAGVEGKVAPHWLRHPRTRARRADPPGAGHARPRLGGHHGPAPARATDSSSRFLAV